MTGRLLKGASWVLALVVAAAAATPARAEPALVRDTPHVWNVSPHAVTIAWFTNADGTSGTVEFGPTESYGTTVAAKTRAWPLVEPEGNVRQHVATLTGLEPDTRYFYRVAADGVALAPAEAASAPDFHFVTARLPSDHRPITFAVLGDGGEGNKYQRAITHQLEQASFDFLLHTGDVVYDVGSDAEWHLNYYPIYRNLIRSRPWFLSLGNHEYLRAPDYNVVAKEYAVDGERLLTNKAYQAAPKKDPNPLRFKSQAAGTAAGYFENAILPAEPGGERYYSFDWGPVHVVVLDSSRSMTPGRPGDAAYAWLVDDLRRSDAPWKVVCFHHPMAAVGKPAYAFTADSAIGLRRDWHPVFERHGVDVVFSGHDHNYQRTLPIVVDPATGEIARDDDRGVVHVVTGGGGGGLSAQSVVPAPAWHSGAFHRRHHFLLVRVDGEEMHITAIGDVDINTPGVTEKEGLGGPAETLDTVTLKRRVRTPGAK